MIARLKQLKVPNLIKKRITLNSFMTKANLKSDSVVANSVDVSTIINFNPTNGTLENGIGLENFKINGKKITLSNDKKAEKIYYYKRFDNLLKTNDDRLVVYCDNKSLCYFKLNDKDLIEHQIDNINFSKQPTAINYNYLGEDVLILSNDKDGLYLLNDNTINHIQNAPPITSMCIHSERLFATTSGEGTTLWFSDDFNIENWFVSLDEAGFIELPDDRGKMLKVISFLDYVYVFRAYGISRITAYGKQQEFTVENLFSNVGKIYANTVTECGDYIIFMASSGIYKFNGMEIVKILPFYDKYLDGVDNEESEGVFYNNKLYLNCNLMINKKIENCIIVYDIDTKIPYIANGLNVNSLLLIPGDLYKLCCLSKGEFVLVNNSGKRFNKILKKEWRSDYSDYSILTPNKKLEKITINTMQPITIYIYCDNNKTLIYDLDSGHKEVSVNVKGQLFSFRIVSRTKSPLIYKPTLYFSYFKEDLW